MEQTGSGFPECTHNNIDPLDEKLNAIIGNTIIFGDVAIKESHIDFDFENNTLNTSINYKP